MSVMSVCVSFLGFKKKDWLDGRNHQISFFLYSIYELKKGIVKAFEQPRKEILESLSALSRKEEGGG